MLNAVVNALFPLVCAACGATGSAVCPACARSLKPPLLPKKPTCVSKWNAAFSYSGVMRRLITHAKYGRSHGYLAWLGDQIVQTIPNDWPTPEIVTWIPATPARRRRRGFDQGELLAKQVGHALEIPICPMFERRDTHAQASRARSERSRGPTLELCGVPRSTTLIVDDVITTGASVNSAAKLLCRHSVETVLVHAAAAVSVPERSDS